MRLELAIALVAGAGAHYLTSDHHERAHEHHRAPPRAVSAAGCTGHSAHLEDAECLAWQALYDATVEAYKLHKGRDPTPEEVMTFARETNIPKLKLPRLAAPTVWNDEGREDWKTDVINRHRIRDNEARIRNEATWFRNNS